MTDTTLTLEQIEAIRRICNLPPKYEHIGHQYICGFNDAKYQAADIALSALEAANRRAAKLEAGGCARDQGTTQYCAEAVALQKRVAELEAALTPFADVAEKYGLPYLAKRDIEVKARPELNPPHNYAQAVMAAAEQTGWQTWADALAALKKEAGQ